MQDSFFTKNSYVVFESLDPKPSVPDGYDKQNKLLAGIRLLAKTVDKKSYPAEPVFVIDMDNGNTVSSIPAEVKELGLTFEVEKIDPQSKKVTLSVRETEKPMDFIIMKAIVFPYIGLVWLGGIITFLGALISMWRRLKENKLSTA